MRRTAVLRLLTLALAYLHTYPAYRHLSAFFDQPSLDEAWKGFGAVVSIGLYLLPVRVQARALSRLWRDHRGLLRAVGIVLAMVHAVPAADHLPRLAAALTWGDAWRGLGSAIAVAWFLAPVTQQRQVIVVLARLAFWERHGHGERSESPSRANAQYASV
jgi:hypothetical protein